MDTILEIIGAIGGLIGTIAGLASLARIRTQNKKDCADASESYAAAARSLFEPLSKRVDDLEAELKAWKNWATRLVNQLRRHNIEPEPFIEPVTAVKSSGGRQW